MKKIFTILISLFVCVSVYGADVQGAEEFENLAAIHLHGDGNSFDCSFKSTLRVVYIDGTDVTVVDGTDVCVLHDVPDGTFKVFDEINELIAEVQTKGAFPYLIYKRATKAQQPSSISEYKLDTTERYECVLLNHAKVEYIYDASNERYNYITIDGATYGFEIGCDDCRFGEGTVKDDYAVFGYFYHKDIIELSARKKKANNKVKVVKNEDTFVMFKLFESKYLGIDGVSVNGEKATRIYTLQGVELNCGLNELAPGIYIINGKKTLVK